MENSFNSDWSLIKSNVTVLIDFPPAPHCTVLPFDDKIINSSTQHFPYTHFHTLFCACINGCLLSSLCLFHLVKIFQTDENKQSCVKDSNRQSVKNVTVIMSE